MRTLIKPTLQTAVIDIPGKRLRYGLLLDSRWLVVLGHKWQFEGVIDLVWVEDFRIVKLRDLSEAERKIPAYVHGELKATLDKVGGLPRVIQKNYEIAAELLADVVEDTLQDPWEKF